MFVSYFDTDRLEWCHAASPSTTQHHQLDSARLGLT
jgi:hypothetical protein